MYRNPQYHLKSGTKLKISAFFVFSFIFCQSVSSQSITWQKLFNGPNNTQDICKDMCLATNGNFYAIGSSKKPFEPGYFTYVMKINGIGDTIWTKLIDSVSSDPMTCASSGDGGVVIAGEGHFALKLDSNGNIAWKRFYNRTGVTCFDILKTNDGGFLACGVIRSFKSFSILNEAYIMKMDFEGNIQWDTLLNSGYYHVLYSISSNSGEYYTLAGSKYNFSTDTSKCSIVKIDIAGNLIWTKQYKINNNGAVANVVTRNTNGYIITGTTNDTTNNFNNIFILKIDSNGNKYYEKIFNMSSNELPYDLKWINSNKYSITVYNNFAKNLLIDSTGKIITERVYPSQYYTIFQSILPMGNGDIIFGGTGRFFGFDEDAYIIRTDSMLNSTPIGILSNNNLSPKNFKLYQNFPNPFNTQTVIKFKLDSRCHVSLMIYSTTGEKVFEIVNSVFNIGENTINFDASNFSSGIYFYKILVENKFSESKKMVLLK